ncbi:unnamed protein product, partial [Staurois parvus]
MITCQRPVIAKHLCSSQAIPSSVYHECCCQTHPPYQPFCICHPSLPIPPLASTQRPPPFSANPSTDLHSAASSTLLCQSLHWPPFSVLHPSLPIPPLVSIQCPPPPLC